MTNPISSVVQLQAYTAQRTADPETPVAAVAAPASTIDAGSGSSAPAGALAPIALSVDRDDAGVFVYTLTDSASGKVLAVIPRSAVVTSAQQQPSQGVDIQA